MAISLSWSKLKVGIGRPALKDIVCFDHCVFEIELRVMSDNLLDAVGTDVIE